MSAPSWATPWRRAGASEPRRSGPKIALIGNCQAREVGHAIRLMKPGSPVTYIPMVTLRREYGDLLGLAKALSAYDYVFSQFFPSDLIAGGYPGLADIEKRLRPFPTIVFPAYHPDMVYAGAVARLSALKLARSPLGQYHSAIALCAYRLGLTVAQTTTLYREEVFARLGYLASWDMAVQDLLANARSIGFPLDGEIVRWARRSSFMHGINHPKSFVIGDIARRLLDESGLSPEPVAVEDYLGDELARDVVWPIYPAIAEAYGLSGSYLFKARPRGKAFPALYDLTGFIAASFELYAQTDEAGRACDRVDAWIATPGILDLFMAAKAA